MTNAPLFTPFTQDEVLTHDALNTALEAVQADADAAAVAAQSGTAAQTTAAAAEALATTDQTSAAKAEVDAQAGITAAATAESTATAADALALADQTTAAAAQTTASAAVPASEVGAASGVSELDSTGNVPASELANAPKATLASLGFTGVGTMQRPAPGVFTGTYGSGGTIALAEMGDCLLATLPLSGVSANDYQGIVKPFATKDSITAKLEIDIAGSSNQGFGIGVTDGTAFEGALFGADASAFGCLALIQTATASSAASENVTFSLGGGEVWLKISGLLNGPTGTRAYWFSRNGREWLQFAACGSKVVSAFTSVGLFFRVGNPASGSPNTFTASPMYGRCLTWIEA